MWHAYPKSLFCQILGGRDPLLCMLIEACSPDKAGLVKRGKQMSRDNSQWRLLTCLFTRQKLQHVNMKTYLLIHMSTFQEE